MNDLIRYHDNDQVIEQNVVRFESPSESNGENTSNLMLGILRRWPIVFMVFILICAVGIPAIWFLIKPLYTVTGAIWIDPILENIVTGKAESGGISNYQIFMNTQAEFIASTRVVQRVADDLIDKNLSFFKNEPTDPILKIKQKLGFTRTNPDPAVILKQAITNGIITVSPADRTELITISMESLKPEEAIRIVNAFINAYMFVEGDSLDQKRGSKLRLLERERDFLMEKLKSHREKIRQSVDKYEDPNLVSHQNIILQRVTMLLSELARVEASKISLETQVKLLDEKFQEQSIGPEEMLRIRNEYINSNPVVYELTRTIIELERDLIVAQQILSVDNPVHQQKQELLDAFQLRLEEENRKVTKEFDAIVLQDQNNSNREKLRIATIELEQYRTHENRLKQLLADKDIEMIKVGRTQLDIKDFQFQFDLDKEMYDRVLQRIQMLEMEQKRPARISVAYPADIGPILDKRFIYTMALIFGALACGVLLASLINKLDLRLQTPDDVSKRIGLRIIGTTTNSHNIKPYLLPEQIAGDYQTIRTNLGLINDEGIPRKLVVTSPGMREGKTTFSINLATSMSRSGKKVLLIDGDLRKPDVADMLSIPVGSGCGLQDVLLGEEFDKAVYTMPSTGLDVLIADPQSRINGYELLASPGTRQCIDMLSQCYDHVIIDTTPILAFPDALIWATLGDAVILVSYAGHTTTPDLKEATDRLTRINVKVLGTVLSNVQSEYGYFRSDLKRYAQTLTSRGGSKRGKRKPFVNMQSIEDNPDDSTTAELNQQVED